MKYQIIRLDEYAHTGGTEFIKRKLETFDTLEEAESYLKLNYDLTDHRYFIIKVEVVN